MDPAARQGRDNYEELLKRLYLRAVKAADRSRGHGWPKEAAYWLRRAADLKEALKRSMADWRDV